MSTILEESIEVASEQITRYFVRVDDPQRETHKRSVKAILGRQFPEDGKPWTGPVTLTPATLVADAVPVGPPGGVPTPQPIVLYEPAEPTGRKTVPHVRGDVRAVSMGRKSGTIVGQSYLVSFNAKRLHESATGAELYMGVSFAARLIAKRTDGANRELLQFDNGVTIVDEMERFRFQRVEG